MPWYCFVSHQISLSTQYRMNKDIMSLSNLLIYNGRLKCGSAAVANQMLKLNVYPTQASPLWMREAMSPERRVVFLDTDGCPGYHPSQD